MRLLASDSRYHRSSIMSIGSRMLIIARILRPFARVFAPVDTLALIRCDL